MAEHLGRLEGKVAIVTGAGSRGPGVGNGKATAVLFASALGNGNDIRWMSRQVGRRQRRTAVGGGD